MSSEPFVAYSTLKGDGVRNIGNVVREIELSDASAATGFPSPTSSNVAELPERTVVALAELVLRADPANWQTEITLTGAVSAGDYTVTLAGSNYTFTASGTTTPEQLFEGLKSAIDSSASANTYVTVASSSSLVVSNGSSAPDARAAFTVAIASGNLAAANDATEVDFQVWTRRGSGNRARWSLQQDIEDRTENYHERFDVSGFDAVEIRIVSTNGRVRRAVLPGVVEV